MLAVTDPHTHKKLGRQVKGFNNKVWDQSESALVSTFRYDKLSVARIASFFLPCR